MPRFNVSIDATGLVKDLHEIQQKQLPFAMARSLTDTAKDAQVAVRASLTERFKLRNNWTTQGIKIRPAEKKTWPMSADVHTDTANRKTGAPDYLGGQETGREKVPYGGHQYIAVPTRYLRRMAPGVIPAELRPRNLLGAVGGRYTARTRKGQMALRNQRIVNGFEFFLQKLKNGDVAIMGRYWTDDEGVAYPFYVLIRQAHIRPVLQMAETVERTVQQRFEQHWQENWAKIMGQGLKL